MDEMKEMKDRIKAFRKALGLKQREVAERLGVRVGTVGTWEIGRDAPGEARIYQLCKEFNVRREWLEHGEGEMFEPTKINSDNEALVDSFVVLFNRLDKTAQEAVLVVLKRLVEQERAKVDAQAPAEEDAQTTFSPILVAANSPNDGFTA